MSELDIAKLTKRAEQGECIADTLRGLSFEDSLKTLKQINNQSLQNHPDGLGPRVWIHGLTEPGKYDGEPNGLQVLMFRSEPGKIEGDPILVDQLKTGENDFGNRSTRCLDDSDPIVVPWVAARESFKKLEEQWEKQDKERNR
jgi:hypothetical protein